MSVIVYKVVRRFVDSITNKTQLLSAIAYHPCSIVIYKIGEWVFPPEPPNKQWLYVFEDKRSAICFANCINLEVWKCEVRDMAYPYWPLSSIVPGGTMFVGAVKLIEKYE